MYKVIGAPLTRTFRVLWTLEELGLDYSHQPAKPQSDEARSYDAAGKVPILIEGEAVITDSLAIMTYLADKHGSLTAPAGTIARAQQDSVINLVNDELDALLWVAARHSFALPEEWRVPAIKPSLKWEFARSISRVESRLTGEYLAGDRFSIADILLTHCLNWAFGAKFEIESPALLAYGKRMRSRAAFQRVAALSK
ncbi:glutathione S-transferase family protein [Tritonibacter horizontis]|uniref:Glutathione S-transferase GstA n=1 Tax=Tritonibacter horizontis TaxID=1768241 RepID=A0A132C2Y4_9RHOB|nr:glutathione S-transferase family protein [Tritonibacter horizontis]KUP95025.1 glutathione S-transferase GstA [Tritonibacter horizontis]